MTGAGWAAETVSVAVCDLGSGGVAGTVTGSVGETGAGDAGATGAGNGAVGCDEQTAVSATPDNGGAFTVEVEYTVPAGGVPAYGVALQASSAGAVAVAVVVESLLPEDLRPLTATMIVGAALPPTVSVSAVSPAPIDRSMLAPGDQQLVVVSGANWAGDSVSVALCEVPAAGLGAVSAGLCDGDATTVAPSSGAFEVRMSYIVPAGGLPESGVAVLVSSSDGEESAVASVIEAAPQPSISASPASADRDALNRGDTVEFTVTGAHWSATPLTGMFCETPEAGADALAAAGCDGTASVEVEVAGGGFTVTMTYTVPASGLPAGGAAIRFSSADGPSRRPRR